MKANNVVAFPTSKLTNFTVEEIKSLNEKHRLEAIETIVDMVVPGIIEALNLYSVEIVSDNDIGMLCETLKSSICRSYGLDHPLQKVADELIRIVD